MIKQHAVEVSKIRQSVNHEVELRIAPEILQQKVAYEKHIAYTIQQREQAAGEVSRLKRRLEKTVGQLTLLQHDMKALRKGKEVDGSSDSDDDAPMGDSDHTTTPAGVRTTQDHQRGPISPSDARPLNRSKIQNIPPLPTIPKVEAYLVMHPTTSSEPSATPSPTSTPQPVRPQPLPSIRPSIQHIATRGNTN